jgi:hypothetical protein
MKDLKGGVELRPAERGERRAPAQTEDRHQGAALNADYTGARSARPVRATAAPVSA